MMKHACIKIFLWNWSDIFSRLCATICYKQEFCESLSHGTYWQKIINKWCIKKIEIIYFWPWIRCRINCGNIVMDNFILMIIYLTFYLMWERSWWTGYKTIMKVWYFLSVTTKKWICIHHNTSNVFINLKTLWYSCYNDINFCQRSVNYIIKP